MRIVLLTIGFRGDVQPFVALGLGLEAAGHEVTIAAPAAFEDFVSGEGLAFAPLRAEHLALLDTEEGQKLVAGNPLRIRRNVRRVILPMIRTVLDDCWEAAQGADVVVYHPKILAGYHIAEKLAIPGFLAAPTPGFSPTRHTPHPLFPELRLGGVANELSYHVTRLMRLPYWGTVNAWRRETLRLSGRLPWASELHHDGVPVPILYAFSPSVFEPAVDWPASTVTTGYWFLDGAQPWEPPADLKDFLERGGPVVYVGFGSMRAVDPARLTEVVVRALEAARCRGVLARGGAMADADLPDHVTMVDEVPHDRLFTMVQAVVHHGGAGTVATGLRAGRPTVVCPFFSDQPFWGKVVAELGVGPPPVAIERLSVRRLCDAFDLAVRNEGIQSRAEALGRLIRSEDGVGKAVEVIDRVATSRGRRAG